MQISLIPWEVIWAIALSGLIITLPFEIRRLWRAKKWAWRLSWAGACLLLVAAIPIGLKLTGYRFDIDARNTEATSFINPLPDLKTRRYSNYSAGQLYQAGLAAVQSLATYGQPWTITFADFAPRQGGRLAVEVPVVVFIDDLAVTVQPVTGTADWQVDVYSASRVGRADLGENGRHIKHFFMKLDAELAKLPPQSP